MALRSTVAVVVDNSPGTPTGKATAYLQQLGAAYDYRNEYVSFKGGPLLYLQDEYTVHFVFANGKVVRSEVLFYTSGLL